jgi:hypothetical protein
MDYYGFQRFPCLKEGTRRYTSIYISAKQKINLDPLLKNHDNT